MGEYEVGLSITRNSYCPSHKECDTSGCRRKPLHAEIWDMTALAFVRFGVSCAAQPRKAGRKAAFKPQTGRVSASGNGASIADLARENGANNKILNGTLSESLPEGSKGERPACFMSEHVKPLQCMATLHACSCAMNNCTQSHLATVELEEEQKLAVSRINYIPKSRWPKGIPPVMGAHLMPSGEVAPISTSKGAVPARPGVP